MKTSADLFNAYNINGNFDRDGYRAERKTLENAMSALVRLHGEHYTTNATPAQTVSAWVAEVGYNTAEIVMASMVNSVGTWDERISRNNRNWAASVEESFDRESALNLGLFSDRIHPTHKDQLASAFLAYVPAPVKTPEEIVSEYIARIDEAEDLDALDAITEEAAERDDISHADYGKIYAAALAKAQAWQAPSKPAKSDSLAELEKYVDGIRDDIKNLYEAEPTDEERDEAEESGEVVDLYSYFSDVLDIEYICDSRGEYIGAKIWVTLGGPNIWIDTREGYVRGAWGCDRAEAWIPSEICDEIDTIFSEYFECVRN